MADYESGKIIRHCRENVGLSPYNLSRRSGVAYSSIRSYESGHSDISFGKMKKLLAVMGYEIVIRKRSVVKPHEIARFKEKER